MNGAWAILPMSDRLSPNTTRLLNGPAVARSANVEPLNRAAHNRKRKRAIRTIQASISRLRRGCLGQRPRISNWGVAPGTIFAVAQHSAIRNPLAEREEYTCQPIAS